jgi:2-methylisocitrate lyase-like PEP mutase family enzyme
VHRLAAHCQELRSLHHRDRPLVLPNAWDAATARAVVAAGFPVVATTSGGVAAALGYEDHEHAPADEMLDAAGRIAGAVGVPVTVDAEAGYGLPAEELVATLESIGAAGCNLEDTDHATGAPRPAAEHAAYLRAVREAASARGYPLVVNARIDVFLPGVLAGEPAGTQAALVPEALTRARAYGAAGADCVFPIGLSDRGALEAFVPHAGAPVNVLRFPRAPSTDELAALGVARISTGSLLHRDALAAFGDALSALAAETAPAAGALG